MLSHNSLNATYASREIAKAGQQHCDVILAAIRKCLRYTTS